MSAASSEHAPRAQVNRRAFLRTVGASAAGVVAATAGNPVRPIAAQTEGRGEGQGTPAGRFGRMFPQLRPFAANSPALQAALMDLGKPGGILDAKDDLSKGPVLLITDLSLSQNNPNNTTHTAGTTFLGQFVDHDLTFDTTSQLGVPKRPQDAPNARTPALDLDSVYGRGRAQDPQLYESTDRAKLKVESGGKFEDLPRAADKSAIIADPRNDENLIIAGLHAAFLKFHNRAVDLVRSQRGSGDRDDEYDRAFDRGSGEQDQAFGRSSRDNNADFRRARRLTTWHYQWIVLHEFLPQIVGQALVDDVVQRGARFFRPEGHGFIPVEFQGAAYRFGHSMVRPSYRANLKGNADGSAFFGLIFDHSQNGRDDPDDLRGGKRAPRRFIGWQTFFKFDDAAAAAEVKPNKKIDTKLSTPLLNLIPGTIAGFEQTPTSLAQRNLLRHLTWGLPSGQAVAQAIGAQRLSPGDLAELRAYNGLKLDESTPLWYYVLKEAELMSSGERLGPVGGRIVAEVLIGLLRADRSSFLAAAPQWRPTLPSGVTGGFRMVDFLAFAQVDPRSRGQ